MASIPPVARGRVVLGSSQEQAATSGEDLETVMVLVQGASSFPSSRDQLGPWREADDMAVGPSLVPRLVGQGTWIQRDYMFIKCGAPLCDQTKEMIVIVQSELCVM